MQCRPGELGSTRGSYMNVPRRHLDSGLKLRRVVWTGDRHSFQFFWENESSPECSELSNGYILKVPFREDCCLGLKLVSAELMFFLREDYVTVTVTVYYLSKNALTLS